MIRISVFWVLIFSSSVYKTKILTLHFFLFFLLLSFWGHESTHARKAIIRSSRDVCRQHAHLKFGRVIFFYHYDVFYLKYNLLGYLPGTQMCLNTKKTPACNSTLKCWAQAVTVIVSELKIYHKMDFESQYDFLIPSTTQGHCYC